MMRKTLLTLLLGCTLAASAQHVRPYLTVGSQSVRLHDKFDELKAGSAFRIGAGCYIPLAEETDFYVVPELSYSSFKVDDYGWIPNAQRFKYHQLHLPVTVDYRRTYAGLFTFDVGAGPFVSYGIGGDAIGTDDFRRWNAGIALRANVRLLLFTIGFSYDLGMLDMTHWDGKETLSMYGLSFGIGF